MELRFDEIFYSNLVTKILMGPFQMFMWAAGSPTLL